MVAVVGARATLWLRTLCRRGEGVAGMSIAPGLAQVECHDHDVPVISDQKDSVCLGLVSAGGLMFAGRG